MLRDLVRPHIQDCSADGHLAICDTVVRIHRRPQQSVPSHASIPRNGVALQGPKPDRSPELCRVEAGDGLQTERRMRFTTWSSPAQVEGRCRETGPAISIDASISAVASTVSAVLVLVVVVTSSMSVFNVF